MGFGEFWLQFNNGHKEQLQGNSNGGVRKEQIDKKFANLFNIFDVNKDGTLERSEISALESSIKRAAGIDTDKTTLSVFESKVISEAIKEQFKEQVGEEVDFSGFVSAVSEASESVLNVTETVQSYPPEPGMEVGEIVIKTEYEDGTVEEIHLYPDGEFKKKITYTPLEKNEVWYTVGEDSRKISAEDFEKNALIRYQQYLDDPNQHLVRAEQKDAQILSFNDFKKRIISEYNMTLHSEDIKTEYSDRYREEEYLRDISQRLYDCFEEKSGAISSTEYASLMSELTSENIVKFLDIFDKVSPEKSLLEYITQEYMNSDKDMKNALTGEFGIFSKLVQCAVSSGMSEQDIEGYKQAFSEELENVLSGITISPDVDRLNGILIAFKNNIKFYSDVPELAEIKTKSSIQEQEAYAKSQQKATAHYAIELVTKARELIESHLEYLKENMLKNLGEIAMEDIRYWITDSNPITRTVAKKIAEAAQMVGFEKGSTEAFYKSIHTKIDELKELEGKLIRLENSSSDSETFKSKYKELLGVDYMPDSMNALTALSQNVPWKNDPMYIKYKANVMELFSKFRRGEITVTEWMDEVKKLPPYKPNQDTNEYKLYTKQFEQVMRGIVGQNFSESISDYISTSGQLGSALEMALFVACTMGLGSTEVGAGWLARASSGAKVFGGYSLARGSLNFTDAILKGTGLSDKIGWTDTKSFEDYLGDRQNITFGGVLIGENNSASFKKALIVVKDWAVGNISAEEAKAAFKDIDGFSFDDFVTSTGGQLAINTATSAVFGAVMGSTAQAIQQVGEWGTKLGYKLGMDVPELSKVAIEILEKNPNGVSGIDFLTQVSLKTHAQNAAGIAAKFIAETALFYGTNLSLSVVQEYFSESNTELEDAYAKGPAEFTKYLLARAGKEALNLMQVKSIGMIVAMLMGMSQESLVKEQYSEFETMQNVNIYLEDVQGVEGIADGTKCIVVEGPVGKVYVEGSLAKFYGKNGGYICGQELGQSYNGQNIDAVANTMSLLNLYMTYEDVFASRVPINNGTIGINLIENKQTEVGTDGITPTTSDILNNTEYINPSMTENVENMKIAINEAQDWDALRALRDGIKVMPSNVKQLYVQKEQQLRERLSQESKDIKAWNIQTHLVITEHALEDFEGIPTVLKRYIARASELPDLDPNELVDMNSRHFYDVLNEDPSFGTIDDEHNNAMSGFLSHTECAKKCAEAGDLNGFLKEVGYAVHYLQDGGTPPHTEHGSYWQKLFRIPMHTAFERGKNIGTTSRLPLLKENYTPEEIPFSSLESLFHNTALFAVQPENHVSYSNSNEWLRIQQNCYNRCVNVTKAYLDYILQFMPEVPDLQSGITKNNTTAPETGAVELNQAVIPTQSTLIRDIQSYIEGYKQYGEDYIPEGLSENSVFMEFFKYKQEICVAQPEKIINENMKIPAKPARDKIFNRKKGESPESYMGMLTELKEFILSKSQYATKEDYYQVVEELAQKMPEYVKAKYPKLRPEIIENADKIFKWQSYCIGQIPGERRVDGSYEIKPNKFFDAEKQQQAIREYTEFLENMTGKKVLVGGTEIFGTFIDMVGLFNNPETYSNVDYIILGHGVGSSKNTDTSSSEAWKFKYNGKSVYEFIEENVPEGKNAIVVVCENDGLTPAERKNQSDMFDNNGVYMKAIGVPTPGNANGPLKICKSGIRHIIGQIYGDDAKAEPFIRGQIIYENKTTMYDLDYEKYRAPHTEVDKDALTNEEVTVKPDKESPTLNSVSKLNGIEPKVFKRQHDAWGDKSIIKTYEGKEYPLFVRPDGFSGEFAPESGAQRLEKIKLPKTGEILEASNSYEPHGTVACSSELDKTIVTSGLLQCAALSIVDKANNKQTLIHVFPAYSAEDNKQIIKHIFSQCDPNNVELSIVPGYDSNAPKTIQFLLDALNELVPEKKVNLFNFDKYGNKASTVVVLKNGELFCCSADDYRNSEPRRIVNPKENITYLSQYAKESSRSEVSAVDEKKPSAGYQKPQAEVIEPYPENDICAGVDELESSITNFITNSISRIKDTAVPWRFKSKYSDELFCGMQIQRRMLLKYLNSGISDEEFVKEWMKDWDNPTEQDRQEILQGWQNFKQKIAKIDRSFDYIIPNLVPMTYYRGVSGNVEEPWFKALYESKVGDEIVPDVGYSMASHQKSEAVAYSGQGSSENNILLILKTGIGTTVSRDYSLGNGFDEGSLFHVVFRRGAKWKVLSREVKDGRTEITLEYIGVDKTDAGNMSAENTAKAVKEQTESTVTKKAKAAKKAIKETLKKVKNDYESTWNYFVSPTKKVKKARQAVLDVVEKLPDPEYFKMILKERWLRFIDNSEYADLILRLCSSGEATSENMYRLLSNRSLNNIPFMHELLDSGKYSVDEVISIGASNAFDEKTENVARTLLSDPEISTSDAISQMNQYSYVYNQASNWNYEGISDFIDQVKADGILSNKEIYSQEGLLYKLTGQNIKFIKRIYEEGRLPKNMIVEMTRDIDDWHSKNTKELIEIREKLYDEGNCPVEILPYVHMGNLDCVEEFVNNPNIPKELLPAIFKGVNGISKNTAKLLCSKPDFPKELVPDILSKVVAGDEDFAMDVINIKGIKPEYVAKLIENNVGTNSAPFSSSLFFDTRVSIETVQEKLASGIVEEHPELLDYPIKYWDKIIEKGLLNLDGYTKEQKIMIAIAENSDIIPKYEQLKADAYKKRDLLKTGAGELTDAKIDEVFNSPIMITILDYLGLTNIEAAFPMMIEEFEAFCTETFDMLSSGLSPENCQLLKQTLDIKKNPLYTTSEQEITKLKQQLNQIVGKENLAKIKEIQAKKDKKENELSGLKDNLELLRNDIPEYRVLAEKLKTLNKKTSEYKEIQRQMEEVEKQNPEIEKFKAQIKNVQQEVKQLGAQAQSIYFTGENSAQIKELMKNISTKTKDLQNWLSSQHSIEPQDAVTKLRVLKALSGICPNEELESFIKLMSDSSPEGQQIWNEAVNKKIFESMEIEYDKALSEKLNLINCKYISQLLISLEADSPFHPGEFKANMQKLVNIIKDNPNLTIEEAIDNLPENIETRKIFESLGYNFDKFTKCDTNSYTRVTVKLDAEESKKAAIKNLEEDLNSAEFKQLPQNIIQGIYNALSSVGVMLKESKEDVFVGDGFNAGQRDVLKLYKNGKPIDFNDLNNIITAIKAEINKNEFWSSKSNDTNIENARGTLYTHLIKLRTAEIDNANSIKEGEEVEIEVHKTNMYDIKKSLCLGNDGACCTGLGKNFNEWSAPNYIMYKCIGAIEITDKGSPVGNTMMYLAYVDGKPALVMDNVELKTKYQNNDNIRDAFVDYAKKICEELGAPDLPIFAGPHRHKLDFSIYNKESHTMLIIGTTGEDEVYIDFCGEYQVGKEDAQDVDLYKIR